MFKAFLRMVGLLAAYPLLTGFFLSPSAYIENSYAAPLPNGGPWFDYCVSGNKDSCQTIMFGKLKDGTYSFVDLTNNKAYKLAFEKIPKTNSAIVQFTLIPDAGDRVSYLYRLARFEKNRITFQHVHCYKIFTPKDLTNPLMGVTAAPYGHCNINSATHLRTFYSHIAEDKEGATSKYGEVVHFVPTNEALVKSNYPRYFGGAPDRSGSSNAYSEPTDIYKEQQKINCSIYSPGSFGSGVWGC
ncbi:hypothetical protein [Hydrogenophaga laconesensis]|uniref:Uncharacterized protein n=1 Tax=Hydrogenophaga laconesensis TaxID=1805971 RepID=A0ABU1VHV6_9BURK|nr:hypothetical protein [Hydrogenophaga laconesensis]MDR7097067.1 hypothetical protein [Hydrogenophaga laconesensis]